MTTRLKPYPSYKASGVEWLGMVPEGWEIKRLKHVCRLSYGDSLATEVRQHGTIPVYGSNGCVGLHSSANTNAPCIIVGRKGSFGKVNFSLEPVFSIDTTFFVDDRFTSNNLRWIYYVLGWLRLDVVSKDCAVPGLDREETHHRHVLVPSLPEQAAIVRYLDYMDRRIQRLIRAKQRLFKLLEEQKQAIIHEAVTGRIDVRTGKPYPSYKPSGVEWLGEVPEHWVICRLKDTLEKAVDCLHATPRYCEEGVYPAIRTADISPGLVRLSSARRVNEEEYTRWTERLVPRQDDILYSREGERFGIAACVPDSTPLCISQRMMVFRVQASHHPEYLMWLLNCPHVWAQAAQDVGGSTAPHVNISTIKNYALAIPTRLEQDAIIEFIIATTVGLAESCRRLRHEIELFREYRTRLISDVVTGKVDVREAAALLPDEPDDEPVEEPDAEDESLDLDEPKGAEEEGEE